MKKFIVFLFTILSFNLTAQSIVFKDSVQQIVLCVDDIVRSTIQEFKFPSRDEEFRVAKLVVTLYLVEGKVVGLDQKGLGFISKIGENTFEDMLHSSCVEIFEGVTRVSEKSTQKIIRVYEYFLAGRNSFFSWEEKGQLTKDVYTKEVQQEIENISKSGEVLDISYQLMHVSYPRS